VGVSLGSKAIMAATIFLAGLCTSTAGFALLAFSATVYSAHMRATGVGWALGFGRIGAVLAPPVAGLLVARAWPAAELYLLFGVPFVLASIFVTLLWREMRRSWEGLEIL
jgi:MFS transporter, AAHS family, 4-hydroxybenzoate transporter